MLVVDCLRNIFCYNLGKTVKPQQWAQFINFLTSSNTRILTLYGMSECNTAFGCQLVDITDAAVPIGYPLPTIQYLLIDRSARSEN